MVSAYERGRRRPTLATLLRLLKAAGYELRMHLAPYDDHDDVLAEQLRGEPTDASVIGVPQAARSSYRVEPGQ